MPATPRTGMPEILEAHQSALLADWLEGQKASGARPDLLSIEEMSAQSSDFLRRLTTAVKGGGTDIHSPAYQDVRQLIAELSRTRAELGFTPFETAMFVFSLKQPLQRRMESEIADGKELAAELWSATTMLDGLGLLTMEAFQRTRDDVIRRQQQEIMELSTPVVKVWEGIVAVPLIGTLDSARTQVVMESLLEGIVAHGATIAIIDITGVPTVDTLVAQHLIKAVAAARLMGADALISGIRPQIAQTMVHLGVELKDVQTKATLADAIRVAFDRVGLRIERV
jgi:rsbT co-antagonist protein RsbR